VQQSVANLKLGGGTAAAKPASHMEPVQEEKEYRAVTPGGTAIEGGRIGAKADSLRVYLQGQMPEADFQQAYSLVRASGQMSSEELQQRVSDVIGAEKVDQLFTLFQLLCFLEDVSAQGAAA